MKISNEIPTIQEIEKFLSSKKLALMNAMINSEANE